MYIRVPREKVAPEDTRRTETVQHHVSQSAGPNPNPKCRTDPSISSSAAAGTRVAAVSWRFRHHFVLACLGLATWRVWQYERGYGGDRTAFRGADAACHGASCDSGCVSDCRGKSPHRLRLEDYCNVGGAGRGPAATAGDDANRVDAGVCWACERGDVVGLG